MFKWLKNRWVWVPLVTLLAMVLVAAPIGFFTGRWIAAVLAVVGVLAGVLLIVLVRMITGREKDDRLERGLEDNAQLALERERASRTAAGADLKSRFADAAAEIKRTLGRHRDGAHEVPWVLVIGAAGSGKTALLSECGLDLPAQYAHARVFGATQTCEFFLFNEAIALDTAGRYFSCDSDEDRAEWHLLLDLLRKTRPALPADAVLVAIPASSLLTLGAPELEEQARQLRRRLNEIQVLLGVDAPVYLVVTKADQIEGFSEFAQALPKERHGEAFGWTNDQRRVGDMDQRILRAFDEIRTRLDTMLHELLLREPDPLKKRRIFVFPQELDPLAQALARLAASAFKRDIYNAAPPFLRGIYLTSALATGEAVSPTLSRLGQGWARTQHPPGGAAPRYLRELFLEVILGDELAVRVSRLGPIARRAILGAAGLMVLGVLGLWGVSFAQNYQGTHELERSARLSLSSDPTIQHLSALRESIERTDIESSSYINRAGFGRLAGAVSDARRVFVAAFGRSFDRYTRQNLEQALGRRDDAVFRAAVATATDLEFLETRGASIAPDLHPYMPRRVKDPDAYPQAYQRFVEWMHPTRLEELTERQREFLARRAPKILDLAKLEDQTERLSGRFGPIRYQDVGLRPPEGGSRGIVAGLFTRAGYDGLFNRLLTTVEKTGTMPQSAIREKKRLYVERFDRRWRRYLLDVPTEARADAAVRKSPHLRVLEQIQTHTSIDLMRDGLTPTWIGMVAEVRRTEVQGEEEKVAPYTEYSAALEIVALDVEEAVSDPATALVLARETAQGKATAFVEALAIVRRIVPRKGDASATSQLRLLLEAPVLDGFSALLLSARRELDRRWNERISSRFGQRLSGPDLEKLYARDGELASFVAEELEPFYRDGAGRGLLGGRSLGLGPPFLSWMRHAEAMQDLLEGGAIDIRLAGVPATLKGAHGLRVKRRELRLICPDEQQTFVYREGSGAQSFRWTTSCQSLRLRVIVGGPGVADRELTRRWDGPLAFPAFLQEAENLGGGLVNWTVRGPDGVTVKANYRIESGARIREMLHRTPPSTLGG